MNKPVIIIKISVVVILFVSILFWMRDQEESKDFTATQIAKPSAIINIEGKKNDTAYLYATYKDLGASVFEDIDGIANCNEFRLVSDITGSVNTKLPGTYFIHYNAKDASGKSLPTATRTVNVVNNSAAFLNGSYNVACTCTEVSSGLHKPTVTANYYTALVTTGSANNSFELAPLNIGLEKIIPYNTFLNDRFIEVNYFSPEYASCNASGTLSPTKNSFTIESIAYPYSRKIIYTCKNVYTKRLVLIANNDNK
jgi:hypothetical protein